MSMKLISKVYFSRIIISNKIIGKKVSPSCFNGVFPSTQNVTCAWEMEPHTHTLTLTPFPRVRCYHAPFSFSRTHPHTNTLTHRHVFSRFQLTNASWSDRRAEFVHLCVAIRGLRHSHKLSSVRFFPGKVWRSSEKGREREKVSRDRRNFGHGKTHIGRDRTKCS